MLQVGGTKYRECITLLFSVLFIGSPIDVIQRERETKSWFELFSTPGSDLPGQAGEMVQSDVPGAWGCARRGPHVWPGLPFVWHLWHPVHHDAEAMSLGQWPTRQWVVSTLHFQGDFQLWLCKSVSEAASNDFIVLENKAGQSKAYKLQDKVNLH